ncbi:MAG TPA: thioredoxin domain-containing protein [Gammaproteobacteria bacterium]|nr:thioredoxin domain-containing protein [Gammaproteobacteria bacterium]
MTEAQSKSASLHTAIILILSLAAILLGAYQWVDLVRWRTAGEVPFCSIGAHMNCSQVWDSVFSRFVQRTSGVPLPGWGIAWAAVVGLLSGRLLYGHQNGERPALIRALRITVLAGVAAIAGLLLYSVSLGMYCLTCIAFYALVLLTAYYTFRYHRPEGGAPSQGRALLRAAAPLLVVFALLIYPGKHTPLANVNVESLTAAVHNASGGSDPKKNPMAQFLLSLPPKLQQVISQSLAKYREEPKIDHPVEDHRLVYGTASAPVHVVEWVDLRCPHCKHMEEALQQIRQVTPPGSWSWEVHYFPLDGECNPFIRRNAGGTSCLASKMLICLSGSPEVNKIRDDMFEHQRELNDERLWKMTSRSSQPQTRLKQCVQSKQTEDTLQADIREALRYKIQGTPLVVVNDKKAMGVPAFIYSLIVTMGRADDPAFKVLPTSAANQAP